MAELNFRTTNQKADRYVIMSARNTPDSEVRSSFVAGLCLASHCDAAYLSSPVSSRPGSSRRIGRPEGTLRACQLRVGSVVGDWMRGG
jgi:hypothetical protein